MYDAETRTLIALAEPHFQGFSEAAETILAALEETLPGTVVLAQCDPDAEVCSVVGARGPGKRAAPTRNSMLPMTSEDSEDARSTQAGSSPVVADILLNPEHLRALSFEAWRARPLEMSDGQIVGVLRALSDRDDVYGPGHLALLAIGARLLGHEWERIQSTAELSRLRNRLRDDGKTDAETGLPNRARFEVLLEREWRLVKRATVRSVVVAFQIQTEAMHDDEGRAMAKLALKDAAAVLAGCARTTDHVGRVGGANFAAVLVGCETTEDAQRFIQRFRSALRRTTRSRPFRIDFSSGVRHLADATSASEALEHAETAARAPIEDTSAAEPTGSPARGA